MWTWLLVLFRFSDSSWAYKVDGHSLKFALNIFVPEIADSCLQTNLLEDMQSDSGAGYTIQVILFSFYI